jgi:prepilin-type N-terminal cleavage/methylation domain-containing protein
MSNYTQQRLLSKKKNIYGFTMVEVIVVIAIIGITVPILFSTLFITMKQQANVNKLTTVKRQGDIVMQHITSFIRNHVTDIQIAGTSVCAPGSGVNTITNMQSTSFATFIGQTDSSIQNTFYTVAKSSTVTQLCVDDVQNTTCIRPLTNTKVTLKDFKIRCVRKSAQVAPMIEIEIVLATPDGVSVSGAAASMNFVTKVQPARW